MQNGTAAKTLDTKIEENTSEIAKINELLSEINGLAESRERSNIERGYRLACETLMNLGHVNEASELWAKKDESIETQLKTDRRE